MRFAQRLDEALGTRPLSLLKGALVVPVPNPRVNLPEKGLQIRGEYHITILEPDEVGDLQDRKGWRPEQLAEKFVGQVVPGEPKYGCLGRQVEPGKDADDPSANAVYFIVVDWSEAQDLRHRLGFEPTDLHVTVGFRQKDIHGVPKDASTCL
jgi:hypothetical protein